MSRIIKFRLWSKETGMILPADTLGDLRDEYILSLIGELFFIYETSNGEYCPPSLITKVKKDIIAMQFTGLQDKNGKDIYEGDIILVHEIGTNYPTRYMIVFNDDELGFKMRWYQHCSDKKYSGFYDKKITIRPYNVFEVIGNKFENPELLKTEGTT